MLNKFRDSGEKCSVYQRDTIVDVGEASGDSRNRGRDKIINGVKSVDNNKQEHSSYYITVNNVLPTNEVESDLLQHYKWQGELQGKLPSNQNIGISNKHLYSNRKDSVITSENQCVNNKIHDIEYVCTNNTNSTFNSSPMGPGIGYYNTREGLVSETRILGMNTKWTSLIGTLLTNKWVILFILWLSTIWEIKV